jgi:ADP-ribose pyrophosphatase YjhB (NUDIX family)
MRAEEFRNLKMSQKGGRSHDITMFIRKAGKFVVIAKHFYPPGLYRAPSGGVNPGEDFIDGAQREAKEETGCEVDIKRYLMRIEVDFCHGAETVSWVSHILVANYLSGDLKPLDTKEIREVRVADVEEFRRFKQLMLASQSGGLHYRAYLQDEVLEEAGTMSLH